MVMADLSFACYSCYHYHYLYRLYERLERTLLNVFIGGFFSDRNFFLPLFLKTLKLYFKTLKKNNIHRNR